MKHTRFLLLLGGAIAGIGSDAALAAGTLHRCVHPVTKQVNYSDTPCEATKAETPAEIAARAVVGRTKEIEAELKRAAASADRQLMNRFPDEAAHRKARLADLEEVAVNIRRATRRLAELIAERKPLDEQREFYKGKTLPPTLQRAIDASEASFAALTTVFRGLEAQVGDIVARYDRQLEHLRKLWAGVKPGSMGLLEPASASAPAR